MPLDQSGDKLPADDVSSYHVESSYVPRRDRIDAAAGHVKAAIGRLDRIARAASVGYIEGKIGVPLSSLTLDEAVQRLSSKGFAISFRSDKEAQLVRKKQFSFPLALILLVLGAVTFGVGWAALVIYLLWYLAKRDELIYLRATADGKVEAMN